MTALRSLRSAALPVVVGFAVGCLIGLVVPGDGDLSHPLQLGVLLAVSEAMIIFSRRVMTSVMRRWSGR